MSQQHHRTLFVVETFTWEGVCRLDANWFQHAQTHGPRLFFSMAYNALPLRWQQRRGCRDVCSAPTSLLGREKIVSNMVKKLCQNCYIFLKTSFVNSTVFWY